VSSVSTIFKVLISSLCHVVTSFAGRPCLKSHATVSVEGGGAKPVQCPSCGWELDAMLVKELLEQQVWEVYDAKLLTKAIRSMSGAVWCPILDCQQPAQSLPSSTEGPQLGKCPVCLFVFCLACRKASHGNAKCKEVPQGDIGGAVGEVEQAGGKEDHHSNRDYEVSQAMFKKSGPKRTQEFLNLVVQDMFASLDFEGKMELVKRYSNSPEEKKRLDDEFGAAYIEYFVNRFRSGYVEHSWERALLNTRSSSVAFTTFLSTIRENKSSDQNSLAAGKIAMHYVEARHASGGTIDLRPCPACFVPIEKISGCPHMCCSQCDTHFCWECLQTLEECAQTRCDSA